MKKPTLIFTLILTLVSLILKLMMTSLNEKIKIQKKRWFFGIEGGVGLFDLGTAAIFAVPNLRLAGRNPVISSTSYFGKLTVGWQRYTSEKIGYRLFWGLGGFGATNFKNFSGDELLPQSAQGGLVSISIDGLFDFV